MKISCKYQDRKTGCYATVWMSLWRLLDASQCLVDWVEDFRTSEQHRPDVRSSFSNFYTELDFRSRHCLGRFCKTSGRCPSFQNIPVFSSNAEMSYSKDRPDARPSRPDVYLLRKDLCYSRRRSQKTVWTLNSQSQNLSRFRISVSL
jgi:hypothetical protein